MKTALVTLYPRGSPLAVAAPQEGRPRPRGRFQPRKGKGKGGGKAYSYVTEGQEADDADIQEILQDVDEENNPQDAPEGIEEDAAEYDEDEPRDYYHGAAVPSDFGDAGGYDNYEEEEPADEAAAAIAEAANVLSTTSRKLGDIIRARGFGKGVLGGPWKSESRAP